jgi:hypothetical protein
LERSQSSTCGSRRTLTGTFRLTSHHARKLLHAIYGIFKARTRYDGNKLFPQLNLTPELQSASR